MSDTCEHGHLSRVCEVCELKAEIKRLRGVCKEAAKRLSAVVFTMEQGGRARAHTLGVMADIENEGSKEDGV